MKPIRWSLFAACALLAACPKTTTTTTAKPAATATPMAAASPAPTMTQNALLQPFTLPYQFPPFDKIKDADFRPAFDAAMAENKKQCDAIAHDPAAPTFENTIVALERSGDLLGRVNAIFFSLAGSNTDDEMQKIQEEIAPKLAAHEDEILLDPALFARVDAVYQKRATLGLDPESAQLLERYEMDFVRAGAKLSAADKTALKQINEQIATLTTKFEQNVLEVTKAGALVIDDVKDLDGLSAEDIGAAAEAAKARGMEGKWVLTLVNTTVQPAIGDLKNRSVRQKLFEASIARGTKAGPNDNTAVVAQLVSLRAKKAALLGYKDFASYSLAEETARTPEAVNKMLAEVLKPALVESKKRAADLQALADADAKARHEKPFKLEPWDWAFYEGKLKKQRYSFDDSEVKPYFEMNRVLQDGVFYAAHELYGISFKERKDLPVYQPDVRVFEVDDDADGSVVGLLILDYYKRDNKRGGAWMDSFIDQSTLLGRKAVVINNLNVPKPAPGQPALLSFDDASGMFHEFGHALHGLLSQVKYPRLSGTNVPRDFVEYPSQFNEMWARDPKVIAHYARHYQTNQPIPDALLQKAIQASTFTAGYDTAELLEAAMIDQSFHQIAAANAPAADQVMAFEQASLTKAGASYPLVPPRYHTTYFLHPFALGYESAYYAYIWSEVLARDTGAYMNAHGGLTRENGDRYRKMILSKGRTEEPSVLFEHYYGKSPDVQPLLEYRGLAKPGKDSTSGSGKGKSK